MFYRGMRCCCWRIQAVSHSIVTLSLSLLESGQSPILFKSLPFFSLSLSRESLDFLILPQHPTSSIVSLPLLRPTNDVCTLTFFVRRQDIILFLPSKVTLTVFQVSSLF